MSRSRVNDYYNAGLEIIMANKRARKLVGKYMRDNPAHE